MKEGKAEIEVFDGVFFNPKMRGLRDISVSYAKANYGKENNVLDSTSATGIRGIRYYLEANLMPTFLEINKKAYSNTIHNLKLNKIEANALNKSIQEFASSYDGAFDFIDLDPFGSAAPYIYDLMKVSKGNTRLMVTATDTAVLCGAHSNACFREYFSIPMHNELCHEAGLRILLYFIARNAAQFNFGIEPELSIANMHYMRVFVKLKRGSSEAISSLKKCGYVAHCPNCRNFNLYEQYAKAKEKCEYCGGEMLIYGPMWISNIKSNEVVEEVIKNYDQDYDKNALKMLELIKEESNAPFFFSLPKITKSLHIGSVSREKVVDELASMGFEVSMSHTDKNSIKGNFGIRDVVDAVKKVYASKA